MDEHSQLVHDSRQRCEAWGLQPEAFPSFSCIISDAELRVLRDEYAEVLSVINSFVPKLFELVTGLPVLLIISDSQGCILQLTGDETIKNLVAQSGIKVGLVFKEEEAGTNSMTLALLSGKPVQIIGNEHYFRFLGSSVCYTVPLFDPDSPRVWSTVSIMTSVDQHNPLLLAMLNGIVESVHRELLVSRQNVRLNLLNQIVIEGTRHGIIITDRAGFISECNTLGEAWVGARKHAFFEDSLNNSRIVQCIRDVLASGTEYRDIEVHVHQSNSVEDSICLFDAYPVYDEHGNLSSAVVQFRDITERHRTQQKIDFLAYHDDLTGLHNRRHLIIRVKSLIDDHPHEAFALMLLDLDRFKRINDNLGHHYGDKLLTLVADRLRSILSPTSLLARMGGDEFVVLAAQICDREHVSTIAQDLIDAFKQPFVIGDYEFHMTASIGISIYPEDGSSFERLMRNADIAMYHAKEAGKNQYVFFESEKNTNRLDQIVLENSLQRAVQNKEFILEYQPQIDIRTSTVIGVEALVRWQHPTHGLIPPNTFIPLAEETGMIEPLGEWVLETACRQLADWLAKGFRPLRMAVNLSLRQFMKPSLLSTIRNILSETQLNPDYLELEITETMTMDFAYTAELLQQIRRLGVHVSIDDFGKGYSNLFYLKTFCVDQLKIDQSFVQNVTVDKSDGDIVSTIISMANNLNIDVIAEGVETVEQMIFLKSQGCYRMQGYLYSRPLAPSQVERFLRNSAFHITGGNLCAQSSL